MVAFFFSLLILIVAYRWLEDVAENAWLLVQMLGWILDEVQLSRYEGVLTLS
jgi:predicted tellurium resistance membrane protein TerC